MAKVYVTTQNYENYAWNEDGSLGTGVDAYWKAKGGSDYFITIPVGTRWENMGDVAKALVEAHRQDIECDNDAFRSNIIGWEIVDDHYLTDYEQSQLRYEGYIQFSTTVLA